MSAHVTTRLPLERHPLVQTHSLEEAISVQSSINGCRIRAEQVDRSARFGWRANGTTLGPVVIAVGQYGAAIRGHMEAPLPLHSLSIPLAGGGEALQHGQSAPLIAGRKAALGSPSMPGDIVLQSEYRGIQVVVPAAVVESTLDVLTGVSRKAPVSFDFSVDLERPGAGGVLRLLDFLVKEADREDGVVRAPAVQARLADAFVCSLLLGFSHNHSQLLQAPAPRAEPAHVRRVEEYIAAHTDQPLTVADLAAVAGISSGRLFAAFRAHRRCSPMTFLRDRRLELARTRLLASAASSVSEIALSCGFEHFGRFSVAYRKRFGESPRHTLERARAAARR